MLKHDRTFCSNDVKHLIENYLCRQGHQITCNFTSASPVGLAFLGKFLIALTRLFHAFGTLYIVASAPVENSLLSGHKYIESLVCPLTHFFILLLSAHKFVLARFLNLRHSSHDAHFVKMDMTCQKKCSTSLASSARASLCPI